MPRTESVSSVISRISSDIKNQTWAPVYVLYGDEVYLKDQFKTNLKNALMPDNASMNYSVYAGSKIDPKAVCQTADTMPFLADHRLILIEDSGFFKSASDPMIELVAHLPENVYMIFCEEQVDKRGRMYKAASKAGFTGEFSTPDDAMLRRWIIQSAKRGGHQISDASAQLLINWCGRDMFGLHNEMEKLISYAPSGEDITEEMIREVCTRQMKDTIFQLTSAIALKDREKAFDAYRDLLGLETKPSQILYMLRREFKLIWTTKALAAEGESEQEIARRA